MAYIGKRPIDLIQGNASYDSFTGDGSTTTFDVTNILPDGGEFDVEVFVDNVRQEAGASKSYTIGNDGSGDRKRVTFNVAPDDSAEIYVINPGRETAVINVADNTISTAKLQADAVTTAKIADSNVTAAKLASSLDLSSKTITLPNTSVTNAQLAGSIANAKLANSSITINGTSVSLGGSVTAGIDWQAVVVADGSTQVTAVAGRGYFLDTNLGVIDIKLPTNPSRGDTFIFADYGNNFATNRVVIDTGGKLIDSTVGGEPGSGGFVLETNGQVVEIVFADDTTGYIVKQNSTPSDLTADSYAEYTEATGGTITTSGNFKIHTFTGDSNFVVSKVGNDLGGTDKVSYMVVAGGGGSPGRAAGTGIGGGAGAGGYREGRATGDTYTASPIKAPDGGLTITATTFPVTVGGGGSAGAGPSGGPTNGSNGSNSIFSTITSAGGGRSGRNDSSQDGQAGGSGGGSTNGGTGGAGNTPPVSPSQGNGGGDGNSPTVANGGGGGGAGGSGGDGQPGCRGGHGGAGVTSCITGSPVARAGGGAGARAKAGTSNCATNVAGGGAGGFGPGPSPNLGTAGTANTGGGAGGDTDNDLPGKAGGKGIVVIRYKFQG